MSKHGEMEFRVDALNDLRAQFVQALEADVAVAPKVVAPRRSFEWRRIWAVPAIALAVVAIVLAISAIPFKSNPTVAEATADVAKVALAADYPPDNWFTYTRSRQTIRNYSVIQFIPSKLVTTERRAWLSVSRRGTIELRDLDDAKARTQVFRYPAFGDYRIGDRKYTRAQIDAFAADPVKLVAEIGEQGAGVGHGQEDATRWTIITEALRDLSPPLPATVRAAMIAELATIEGVSVVDNDEDPRGRPATGLSFPDSDVKFTVYFDKNTSALIYSDAVIIGPKAFITNQNQKIGDVLERFELLDSRATPVAPELKVRY